MQFGKMGARGGFGSGGLLGGARQFDIFVDSVNGNDANSGLYPSVAKKTIAAGQALITPTLHRVGLACGSQWREQLTNNIAGAIVGSYGSGALPILDGSDLIANAGLTKTAGLTNVYQTGTITFIEGGLPAWVNVWETGGPGDSATGTFLSNQTSQAACDATPGSYYIPSMTTTVMPTTGIIYIHATDSSNPITSGYTYEFANRSAGLLLGGANSNVSNIETRKSADNNGSLLLQATGITATGVIVRDGGKHNMLSQGGGTIKNSTLINNYYPGGGNLLVFFENTGSGLPITVTGNIFQQDQITVAGQVESCIISHTAGGSFGAASVTNNWFIAKNGAKLFGVSLANVPSLSTSGNFASQLSGYIALQQPTVSTNDQYVSGLSGNTAFTTLVDGVSLALLNSKIAAGLSANGLFQITNANVSLVLTNNLLYLNTPVLSFEIGIQSAVALSMTINGCDFGTANSEIYYYNNFSASGSTFSGDNNIYEAVATPHWALNNSYKTTLTAWQTLTGQDAHSVTTGGNAALAATLPTIPTVN